MIVMIQIGAGMVSGGTVEAIAMMEGERDTESDMTKETAGTTTEVYNVLLSYTNKGYYS